MGRKTQKTGQAPQRVSSPTPYPDDEEGQDLAASRRRQRNRRLIVLSLLGVGAALALTAFMAGVAVIGTVLSAIETFIAHEAFPIVVIAAGAFSWLRNKRLIARADEQFRSELIHAGKTGGDTDELQQRWKKKINKRWWYSAASLGVIGVGVLLGIDAAGFGTIFSVIGVGCMTALAAASTFLTSGTLASSLVISAGVVAGAVFSVNRIENFFRQRGALAQPVRTADELPVSNSSSIIYPGVGMNAANLSTNLNHKSSVDDLSIDSEEANLYGLNFSTATDSATIAPSRCTLL